MTHVQDRPLSIPKFTLLVAVLTTLNLLTIRFAFPNVWQLEMSLGWWLLLVMPLTICIQHFGMAGFEWAFHRYVLHNIGFLVLLFNRPGARWIFRGLIGFKTSHEAHHNRTLIYTKKVDPDPNRRVYSDYSMERAEQFEGSSFPWWSLLGFWAFFSIFLIPLHLLWPRVPILIGGMIAVAFSYYLYEVIHSIHHYPFEWWKRRIENSKFCGYFRRRFAFHQFHHYRRDTNEAVAGFLSFELWDRLMRTYHYPPKLLLHDKIVTAEDLAVHKPIWIIRKVDAVAKKLEDMYRVQVRTKQSI